MSTMKPLRRIVCAMSGGVDSTVAALFLKKRRFDVVGVFMRNWNVRDEFGNCQADQESAHAEFACRILGIPFHEVSLEQDYWIDVFEPLIDAYQNGLTPNPDVLCNRHVKFGSFLQKLRSDPQTCRSVGDFDAVATGHYAASSFGDYLQCRNPDRKCRLMIPRDVFKDQTLFLSQINQGALQQTCFPLSSLLKRDVKRIAEEAGFGEIASKKESTGICFIGNRRFSRFMREYINSRPGRFIHYDSGQVIGRHDGIHLYTHGQRALIGGKSCAYFVAFKDVDSGDAVVVNDHEHDVLHCKKFWMSSKSMHWISGAPPWSAEHVTDENLTGFRCGFRFQHTHPIVPCTIYPKRRSKVNYSWQAVFGSSSNGASDSADGIEVVLDEPYFSLTPGQYAVFYSDNNEDVRGGAGTECLGSAVIAETEATVKLRAFLHPSDANLRSVDSNENERIAVYSTA